MQRRGTTDAIFILREFQEKFHAKNKNLYFAFKNLSFVKVFNRVPHQVLCWAMRRLGADKWIIQLVQAMYHNVSSKCILKTVLVTAFV